MAKESAAGGVQSVERSALLLDVLARAGGRAALADIAAVAGLPMTTIHRLLRTLVELGFVRQTPSRHYALGPGLIPLGELASQMLGAWAHPHLAQLARDVGETANLAMFERDGVVYLAQVPSPHAMRMFTEVGRHVDAHCTGMGKAMLAELDDAEVLAVSRRAGLTPRTDRTLTTEPALLSALAQIRAQGYAVDEGEQEIGVRCLAMAVPGSGHRFAVSVSGPAARITAERDADIVPALRRTAEALSRELQNRHT